MLIADQLETMPQPSAKANPRTSAATGKTTYRKDIDGLRAIAVLAVVGYHFFDRRLRGGFVGVDIFFVISGYLISSIIYRNLEQSSFSIREFYVRRIRRIYPALLLVLVFACFAGWILMLPSGFASLGKQIAGGSAFVANFVLWTQSGYFSPDAAQKPLLHLWSLGVEEQFYLVFPALCVAGYRSRSRKVLPVALTVLGIASMALNVASAAQFRGFVYFLPFARLWELLTGAGLAFCIDRRLPGFRNGRAGGKWNNLVGFAGLVLLVVAIFRIDRDFVFPGWWALLPVAGATMIIAAGAESWCNRRVLSCKPAVFVGLISYPLYLWHWPLLCFARIATGALGQHGLAHGLKAAIICVSFGLAYLTWRFVETPIRRAAGEDRRRRGAWRLFGGVSLAGVFGGAVVLAGGFPSRMPAAVNALDHDYAGDAAKAYREGSCFLRSDQSAQAFAENCLDSANAFAGKPLVLVWGDSHAADLIPGFRAIQPKAGVRLAQYTASLCPPIVGLHLSGRVECTSVNTAVLSRIRALRPQIVVLSARWGYLEDGERPAERARKLTQTILQLKAAGVPRVVVIGSAPFWKMPVTDLLIDRIRQRPDQAVPDLLGRNQLEPQDDAWLRDAVQESHAAYVSALDKLCDQDKCLVTTGPTWRNVITYDNAHLTEHGSTILAERMWQDVIGSQPLAVVPQTQR